MEAEATNRTHSATPAGEGGAAGWTAVLVLAVGVLASLALSVAVRHAEQASLQREVDRTAEAVRRAVIARLEQPIAALRGQMELWAGDGAQPGTRWVAEAERFLEAQPGLEAVVRFSPDGRRTVAAKEDGQRLVRELAQVTAPAGESTLGPIRVASGGTAMGIQLEFADGPEGTGILAIVDPGAELEPRLSDLAPHAAIELSAAGVTVLELGEPALETGDFALRELELRTALGPVWTLRVRPSVEAVAQTFTLAPGYTLAAGLLISVLLATVVYLAQVSSARTRTLEAVQRTLEQRVADRARAEAEVRELNQSLEARVAERTGELNDAVLELETFVYSVSHDLRSPLGAIVNFAAILAEDYHDRLDAAGRDHLARISRSAQSAVAMMNALLAFSRTGRQEMRKGWVDVEEIVHSVVAELSIGGSGPKPTLVTEGLPPAFADPGMLRLVFQNLISNALKFSREGSQPHIEVVGRADALECEYAVIDDGVGFDMRHASKLFRVFERLHSAEQFPGNGVGLAIVARVVRRHGGRISAEGAPGKGATFRFALPRA